MLVAVAEQWQLLPSKRQPGHNSWGQQVRAAAGWVAGWLLRSHGWLAKQQGFFGWFCRCMRSLVGCVAQSMAQFAADGEGQVASRHMTNRSWCGRRVQLSCCCMGPCVDPPGLCLSYAGPCMRRRQLRVIDSGTPGFPWLGPGLVLVPRGCLYLFQALHVIKAAADDQRRDPWFSFGIDGYCT